MKHKRMTIDLSEEGTHALAFVAARWGMSRPATIELLIRRERGLPPFEQGETIPADEPSPEARFEAAVESRPAPELRVAPPPEPEAAPEQPLTVASPWQDLPVVRDVDGSTGPVPDWITELAGRIVMGEELLDHELRALQRWRRGFDDEVPT